MHLQDVIIANILRRCTEKIDTSPPGSAAYVLALSLRADVLGRRMEQVKACLCSVPIVRWHAH